MVGNFPFPEYFLGGCHRAYVTQTYGSKGQSEPMEDSRSGLSEQRYCCTTSICDHNQQPTFTTPLRSHCRLLYVVTSNRWSTRIHCLSRTPRQHAAITLQRVDTLIMDYFRYKRLKHDTSRERYFEPN